MQASRDILGVDAELHPETPADVESENPHRSLAEAKALGELLAHEVRHLSRHVHGQLGPPGAVLGDHGTGLHRQSRHAVDGETPLHHDIGLSKARLDIAASLRVRHEQVGLEDVRL